MVAPKPTRRRRTAEDARAAIMDAAEKRLIEAGPSGIRLQEIAADVSVSHPTILHHFGSREALVSAVLERLMHTIYAEVLLALSQSDDDEDELVRVLDRAYAVLSTQGRARVFYWLALEGIEPPNDEVALAAVVQAAHEIRTSRRSLGPTQTRAPSLDDTRFLVVLSVLALTSQSILGPHLLTRVGLDGEPKTLSRFRAWLGRLLHAQLGAH
ncbi:MAG: TetR/AcrR family transcriptional regulator [Deltaproteobacteria bacterium]|nr:TetR/AcrR family transcriptional regulator [Deltaproteobacteria bacterium]